MQNGESTVFKILCILPRFLPLVHGSFGLFLNITHDQGNSARRVRRFVYISSNSFRSAAADSNTRAGERTGGSAIGPLVKVDLLLRTCKRGSHDGLYGSIRQ